MGYGKFVYNQDYSKAKNIFERKYPMEIRECLSSYPLDTAVSFYPCTQAGELHPAILSHPCWSENKIVTAMKTYWTHSWKSTQNSGGSISTQMFKNIDSLNVSLPIKDGAGETSTIRKFILSMTDPDYKRAYFIDIAPETSREYSIAESSVNVNLTMIISRPERQAILMKKALQLIPKIPTMLLDYFGKDVLGEVLDPFILDRVTADGTLPPGIIPAVSYHFDLDLDDMEDDSIQIPNSDGQSVYKLNEAESMGDVSRLSEGQSKGGRTARSAQTAETTQSTRRKLLAEQELTSHMMEGHRMMEARQAQIRSLNVTIDELLKIDGGPSPDQVNKLQETMKQVTALNWEIQQITANLNNPETDASSDDSSVVVVEEMTQAEASENTDQRSTSSDLSGNKRTVDDMDTEQTQNDMPMDDIEKRQEDAIIQTEMDLVDQPKDNPDPTATATHESTPVETEPLSVSPHTAEGIG